MWFSCLVVIVSFEFSHDVKSAAANTWTKALAFKFIFLTPLNKTFGYRNSYEATYKELKNSLSFFGIWVNQTQATRLPHV